MNKESISQIKDSEELRENELFEVEGGEDSDEDCTCVCWIGNENHY